MTALAVLLLASATLEEQTMLRILGSHFQGDYVLVTLPARTQVGVRWRGGPAPVGSLVKPFTALAWGEANGFRYPQLTCRGGATGCWLPAGHGRIGVREAIAHSCNAWFAQLAEQTTPAAVIAVWKRYGIAGLPEDVAPPTLIGSGSLWRFDGPAVAQAYAELLHGREQPGVRDVVAGMTLAAEEGTASVIGGDVLAKTGTAWCAADPGDGYVVVAFPRDSPRYLVLLRLHGTTGASAARIAAPVIRELAGTKP